MFVRRLLLVLAAVLLVSASAWAQLPPDAVLLDKVKIPEKQKPIDLCPVYLEPADRKLESWE